MNITYEHLSAYLPYGLLIQREGKIVELCGLDRPYKTNDHYHIRGETKVPNGTYRQVCSFYLETRDLVHFKPLLRPMHSLTKSELHRARFVDHIDYLTNEFDYWVSCDGISYVIDRIPYGHMKFLFENHYDIFGLIDAGSAIDINTITLCS
jgi:hypothetical protein